MDSSHQAQFAERVRHGVRSQPLGRLRAGSQNPEFRRKPIKIEFLLATYE